MLLSLLLTPSSLSSSASSPFLQVGIVVVVVSSTAAPGRLRIVHQIVVISTVVYDDVAVGAKEREKQPTQAHF